MAADESNDDRTQSFVALAKDTAVSHYKIINKIGAGGMGEVYLAQDTQLDRKVALKFLPPHLCQDEDCRARFKREAQAAAKLDHPNIISVYEVSEYQGRPYFTMAHVEGKSLKEFSSGRDLPIEQILELAIQICDGLHAAHEKGVTHRDIKPSNILIDSYGRARIVDFGLASVRDADHLTKSGSTMGTVGYMSPEQVRGREVDHRSDLFSFGVVLYELITKQNPFKRDSEAATLKAVSDDTPEPLARFKRDIPEGMQAIIDKALEKDVKTRYQHADGLCSDLMRMIAPTGSSIAAASTKRKHRWPVWVGAGGIAALLVISGYLILDRLPIGEKSGVAKSDETVWENSIAVLPFRDFSPNKDQEYFCDGMTDAIIGRLSGVEALKVISMTSVMRYKTPDRDLRKIGRDLRVNTVLEGSIQREDHRIRVRAQLINVADDAHLWSETYDQELESVFDIQDNISRAIVDAMRIKLFGKDEAVVTRRYTQNIEAYNFYMRGRHLWGKRTEQDLRRAIEHFEKAIELDPNYALAYSGLADAWSVICGYLEVPGAIAQTEATAKAKEAAQMAIGLDEGLAEAHASLGLILRGESDLEGAEKEFLRAIELNPGYAWAHFWYSLLLEDMARYPDQIREEDIAFELNPMSIPLINNRALTKTQACEWQEAQELHQRLIEVEPNRIQSYIYYAYFLAQSMGRNEDALRQCSLAVQIDKQAYKDFAYIYEWVGDLDRALWAANMYLESTPDKHDAYDTRGHIYALNGMLDSAIVSFKQALELKPDFVSSLWKLGNVYMFRQEYAKAESLYQIIASYPDKYIRVNGRLFLTQIPLHQGKLKKGLRMLRELEEKALAESVRTGEGLAYGGFKRAAIYLMILNDPESSTAELEKVLETLKDIYPNSWMVANSRGCIAYNFAKAGNFEKAEQLLEELERDIDRYGPSALVYYWFNVSGVEELKGNYDIARAYLEKLYKVYPWFYARRLIGLNYLMAGRPEDAVRVLEEIVNRYELNRAYWPTTGVLTHFELGQAYEEAGRYDEAIKQYETFLDIWKNADPEISFLDEARDRLTRLKSKP